MSKTKETFNQDLFGVDGKGLSLDESIRLNRHSTADLVNFILILAVLILISGSISSCRSSALAEQTISSSNPKKGLAKSELIGNDEIQKNWKDSEAAKGQEILPISWTFSPAQYRGRNGQLFIFSCPAQGNLAAVYGTDVYTDDSSICTAAVYEGLITQNSGGIVAVEIRPGQDAFVGGERNNVKTLDFNNHWNGAFIFVGNSDEN